MKLPKQPQRQILEQLDLIQRFNDTIVKLSKSRKKIQSSYPRLYQESEGIMRDLLLDFNELCEDLFLVKHKYRSKFDLTAAALRYSDWKKEIENELGIVLDEPLL